MSDIKDLMKKYSRVPDYPQILCFRLPRKYADVVKALAKSSGVSLSVVIKTIVMENLDKYMK